MKTLHYKVVFGFDAEDYVPISAEELEKAIWAHMRGKNVAFEQGSVSGERIVAVQPDYHSAMGWNRGYTLGADDYAELTQYGVDKKHSKFLAHAKDRIQYLVETKQEHLIGKNMPIPELEHAKESEISDGVKKLAASMRV